MGKEKKKEKVRKYAELKHKKSERVDNRVKEIQQKDKNIDDDYDPAEFHKEEQKINKFFHRIRINKYK